MQNTVPKSSVNIKTVHVAVAVIERFSPTINTANTSLSSTCREILISKRAEHVHQGGFWEFPGGKVEAGECVTEALARELFEELGIEVHSDQMSPLIKIEHDYGDKRVLLDVYTVHGFQSEAVGKEGQPIKWVKENKLSNYTFPDANQAILSACRLPSFYFITPEYEALEDALFGIQAQFERGDCLFLLRQHQLDRESYQTWVTAIMDRIPAARERMLLSHHFELPDVDNSNFDDTAGVHLPFYRATELRSRPVIACKWFGVSCHNLDEIKHAQKIGADFITVSPVLHTATHPEAVPLGWNGFSDLVEQTNIPVYALGGMMELYLQQAKEMGAQGIAGIRMFLSK